MSNERDLYPISDALVEVDNKAKAAAVRDMIRQILDPIFDAFQTMIGHNNEAFAQITAAMTIQSERMDALEKQIRLATPVTPGQVRYINGEIRRHARDLLARKEAGYEDDAKAVAALGRLIRKAILVRYGITALNELPKCEYSVVISQIELYNDTLAIRDIIKEAKKRAEEKVCAGV